MSTLILTASSVLAAGFNFDNYTSASALRSDLSEYSSSINTVRLQNYRSSDDMVKTMAVVTLQDNAHGVALIDETCKGTIADGCFAGYQVLSAVTNVDSDNLSATLWAWNEDGTFGKVGTIESKMADGSLLSIASWDESGLVGVIEITDDGSIPEAMTGVEIVITLVISFGAGVAANALYDLLTTERTAPGEDYDGDGTTNENDADDDSDGRLDDEDEYPWDPQYSVSQPVDISQIFQADELIEQNQVVIY